MKYYCPYCNKLLDKQKGEIAHGCLDCHGMTHVPIIDSLKKQIEILEGACSFYGDKDSWFQSSENDYVYLSGIRLAEHETISEDWEAFGTNSYGGKKARTALKEVQKLRGE